jgi:hypothetical protein
MAHEHDLVWVTSPDETQARQYCRSCGHREPWGDLPPELQPTPEQVAALVDAHRNGQTADGGKG